MTGPEFDKIWRLMQSLWPNAAAKKTERDKKVWAKMLEPYPMQVISDRVMSYARSSKFFPDVADLTKGLLSSCWPDEDAAIIHVAKLYGKIVGIETPEFQTKDEATEWFRGLEETA